MSDKKPVLLVIIASIRESRKGHMVGEWFAAEAEKYGAFDVRIADLKAIDLPLMTEPNQPYLQQYTQEKTWEWSRLVDSADAFAFVMPEYNASVSAPLANAIDYLHKEWSYKPAVIVSYGGISGGARATQELRTRLTALSIVSMPQALSLPFFTEHIQDDVFVGTDRHNRSVVSALDAVMKWHPALASMRAPVAELSAAD